MLDTSNSDCNTTTEEYADRFIIYPNPSHGIFTIKSNLPLEKISMISSRGSSVNDPECIYKAGEIIVKTNALPSGIYILAMYTAREIFYKKIVIN